MDRRMSDAENRACLQDLQATDPHLDKQRIQDAKGGLLQDAYRWVLKNAEFRKWHNDRQSPLLWIRGDPGKGKTMLLCGIIDELDASPKHGDVNIAFFFCQATDASINNATAVLRGLIFMLVKQQPILMAHLRKDYEEMGKRRFEGVNAWVALSKIFTRILQDTQLSSSYLIIDALDECTTDLDQLLGLIQSTMACDRIKWIVSSRNWPSIKEGLDPATQKVSLSLELNEESISAAVAIYIETKVDELKQKKNYGSQTQNAVRRYLLDNADNTFLWVALVCEELLKATRWEAKDVITTFPTGLEALYTRMTAEIFESKRPELFISIIATISAVYRPITLDELTGLVELPDGFSEDGLSEDDMAEIVGHCGSFLTIRDRTISFVHQSAKDFVINTASHRFFPSGIKRTHSTLFSRSLLIMSKLRRDIYNLMAPGFPITKVKPPNPDPLAEIRYSCIHWVDHLDESIRDTEEGIREDLQDGGKVDAFLRTKYLYWLEALSLLGSTSNGVLSMAKLERITNLTSKKHTSKLGNFVRDGHRFSQFHRAVIENYPLQIYTSALLFSPTQSLIRKQFQAEEPQWMVTKQITDKEWNACLSTLEGHSNTVRSVAWLTDGRRLASASYDNTIKIWDAATSEYILTLEGHNDAVNSIAWSTDSHRLVSASGDKTVKIWNAATGKCMSTLEGHSDSVRSVAWSTDGRWLASASSDKTYILTFEGYSGSVGSVAWSSDDHLLASTSSDDTVKIWDITTDKCLSTLQVGFITFLKFDAFKPQLLYTSAGTIDLGSKVSQVIDDTYDIACLPQIKGYGLKNDMWITYQGQDLIWLPLDYRHHSSAIVGESVAIGCQSGWVLILAFSPHNPPIAVR
ncbi:hypothetical protein GQ53DRAFT_711479 [Thozetella sp. PMI_491]|nr:hypothetical protein GQ53DRAFT_711479 [Thozetella sp. PMI_491]